MKIIQIILGMLFILFAAVQLNDPDPFLWIVIYGVVGAVSLLRAFGYFPRSMVFLFLMAIGAYTLLHIPYVIEWVTIKHSGNLLTGMSEDRPYIEGSREFFGLLMADLTLVYLLYYRKTRIN